MTEAPGAVGGTIAAGAATVLLVALVGLAVIEGARRLKLIDPKNVEASGAAAPASGVTGYASPPTGPPPPITDPTATPKPSKYINPRPLTKEEHSDIIAQIRAGKPLTGDQKKLLRANARWLWQQKTGKPIPEGYQVHHLRPLQDAHLFEFEDPNDPKNLALIESATHSQLHFIEGTFRKSAKKYGPEESDIVTKAIQKIFKDDLKILNDVKTK